MIIYNKINKVKNGTYLFEKKEELEKAIQLEMIKVLDINLEGFKGIEYRDFLFDKIYKTSKIPNFIIESLSKWIINNNDIVTYLNLNGKDLFYMYRKCKCIGKIFKFLKNGNHKRSIKNRKMNSSHFIYIIKGNDWEEKLKLYFNNDFYSLLERKGITNRMYAKIVSSKDWKEKIEFLRKNGRNLQKLGLRGKKLGELIYPINWKNKIKQEFGNFKIII